MTQGTLADADGVAALLAWQRAHPAVIAAFGSSAHVSGRNEAPYPRHVVSPGAGGDDRDLLWATDQEVLLATYGALDGTPGRAALWRLHRAALAAARQIGDADSVPGQAVVTRIRSSAPTRFVPEPGTGQPVWRSGVLLTVHPPAALAAP